MRRVVLVIVVIALFTATAWAGDCDFGLWSSWECEIAQLQDRVIAQRVAEIPYAFGLPNLLPQDKLPNLLGRNDLPNMGPVRDELPDLGKK